MKINKTWKQWSVEGEKIITKVAGNRLGEVGQFCYLGSKITKDSWFKHDIKSRIISSKKSFAWKKITHFYIKKSVNQKTFSAQIEAKNVLNWVRNQNSSQKQMESSCHNNLILLLSMVNKQLLC